MHLPPFEIDGGLPLALARGLAVAGSFALFGAAVARVTVLPTVLLALAPPERRELERRYGGLIALAICMSVPALAGWAWLVAGTLAESDGLAGSARTCRTLLTQTVFGHVLLLQVAAVAVAGLAVVWRRHRTAAMLAGLAVLLQAWHGHTAGMGPAYTGLFLSGMAHLLAGAAWLGGLPPLLLVLALAPSEVAQAACRRFSVLGTVCVVVLAATAGSQFLVLIGGLPGLIGTAYGLLSLLKLGLFAVLLGLAARHRFRLVPALPARPGRLLTSVSVEAAVGLVLVLSAGVLCSLPPAMHTQPVWPFSFRPSLVTVREDPRFRLEVLAAGAALVGAVALAGGAALIRHRARWLAVTGALAIAWFAVPHLDLLLVAAYPTSYAHSPTGFAAAAIVEGAALYPAHCASCHGRAGQGDGPEAARLPVPRPTSPPHICGCMRTAS